MGECHRARTRTARQRLDDLFYPVIERNDINFVLETSCPLARELDMLRPFEELKRMKRRGEWQCQKCSKIFRGEDYLDKHMSRKHMDLLCADSPPHPPPPAPTRLPLAADLRSGLPAQS